MTPDPRLLVQATPDLLERWCGPVVYDGVPATVRDGQLFYRSTWDDGLHCSDTDSEIPHVRLDLSRAECRDRVARVLAGMLLREVPPGGGGYTWRCEPVGFCWELRSHNLNWSARFAPDTRGWFGVDEGNRTGRFPSRSVPALSALNPNDDTRLPDGSRLVDALALAEVWRATGGAR